VLVTADGSSSPSGGDLLPNPGDSDLLPTLEQLGPVAVDGNGIVRATAVVNESTGEAVVNPLLAPGSAGLDAFNAVAAACYGRGPTCPTGRIAVVLDGVVLMAPAIRAPSFAADQLQISGNWTLSQAEDVARRISAAAHG
jgi:preprotein translocase subunit SecD